MGQAVRERTGIPAEDKAPAKAQRPDSAWLVLETASIQGVQNVGVCVKGGVVANTTRRLGWGTRIQIKKFDAGRSPNGF